MRGDAFDHEDTSMWSLVLQEEIVALALMRDGTPKFTRITALTGTLTAHLVTALQIKGDMQRKVGQDPRPALDQLCAIIHQRGLEPPVRTDA